ncbi:MAG: hypothetical protein CBC74_002555 [Crocinitomicaceae bacterium TMED114]|nr:MAG: hypothetical protein CBC74_002555 [Crocinitomicaceae bacterium TMED114]
MRFPTLFRLSGLLALLLILTDAQAQRRSGRGGFFQPQRPGAIELSGAALLSNDAATADLLVHPGVELTWIGRAPGPIHTGIRLGLGQLDHTQSAASSDAESADTETRTRLLLPEVSSVLRLDPFRGGIRPFVEGEIGLAASLLDERTFDDQGQRTAYGIPAYDATAHCGWAAGARLRLGEGVFLALRYGKRFGGALDLPEPAQEPTVMPAQLDGQRSRASAGFSFAF